MWDNNKIAQRFEKSPAKNKKVPVRTNCFDFIAVKILGNSAWIAYHNNVEFLVEGKVTRKMHWLESATEVKNEIGWKLDMLHSTPIR